MSTLYRYDEDDVPRAAALDGGAGPEPLGAESDEDLGEPEPSRAIRGCLIGLAILGAIVVVIAAAAVTFAALLGWVQRGNGTYWIADLGSTNGTWIKRGPLAAVRVYGPTPLLPGDQIRIGRTLLPWEVPA